MPVEVEEPDRLGSGSSVLGGQRGLQLRELGELPLDGRDALYATARDGDGTARLRQVLDLPLS